MTVRWPAKRGDIAAAVAEVNDLSAAVTWANIPIANVPTGTSGTTVALGDHTHTGVYEPADATILKDADIGSTVLAYSATVVYDADIGSTVQAYDVDTMKSDVNKVVTAEWNVPAIARNKTASYTMVLGDAGQVVRFTGATASKVCTIPANASVAFPIGTMIGITNDGSATMTLAITTDTMTWGKDNTTGTRTLAAGADCVILKTTSTTWKVNGSALVT
jgi:hypothetical protein